MAKKVEKTKRESKTVNGVNYDVAHAKEAGKEQWLKDHAHHKATAADYAELIKTETPVKESTDKA